MKIFNSLTGQKEIFVPLTPGHVKLYVCGMTVYDYSHIGHARSLIIFDMVVRYFKARSYKVTYVRNITDIDDKIINRARENRESPEALAERFIEIMHADEQALNVLPPDYEPRATQHISEMIQLIQTLLDRNYAYCADNGDIYFDVHRMADYGKLSRRHVEQLKAGARLEINESKKNPLDFVLWKKAAPDEPQWPSPWGPGRPGWHIECSAMATLLLGQPFDIHGGGLDLKFPHHENEIAQSESAADKPFARYWMHAGLLEIDNEKMSKSLCNIITICDALKKNHPDILRYVLLSAHYRSPIHYSAEALSNARLAVARLYRSLLDLPEISTEKIQPSEFTTRFYEAMDDDFNTALALSILFDMAHEINRLRDLSNQKAADLGAELKYLGNILGLLQEDPKYFLQGDITTLEVQQIEKLISARAQARQEKNWALADRIRDELLTHGIAIEDSPSGTTWQRVI